MDGTIVKVIAFTPAQKTEYERLKAEEKTAETAAGQARLNLNNYVNLLAGEHRYPKNNSMHRFVYIADNNVIITEDYGR